MLYNPLRWSFDVYLGGPSSARPGWTSARQRCSLLGVAGYPIRQSGRVGWTAGQVAGCSAAVVELPVGSSSCYDGNELRGQAAMGPSPIGRCGSSRRVGEVPPHARHVVGSGESERGRCASKVRRVHPPRAQRLLCMLMSVAGTCVARGCHIPSRCMRHHPGCLGRK